MKGQYEYNLSKLVPWVYEDEGGLLGVPRPGTEEAAAPGWSSAQRRKRGRNEADARDEAVRVCQQWPVTTPRPASRPPGRAARRPRVSSPRPGAAPHRSTACDCSVSVISMPHGLWSSYRLMRITNYRVFGSRRDARAHTCAAGAGPAGTKKRASTHYTPRAETGTAISAQAGHLTRSTHAHEHGPTFRHPTPHARPAETPGSAGSRRFICNCILARDGGTLPSPSGLKRASSQSQTPQRPAGGSNGLGWGGCIRGALSPTSCGRFRAKQVAGGHEDGTGALWELRRADLRGVPCAPRPPEFRNSLRARVGGDVFLCASR